jgi:hypothetical protein
MISAFAVAGFAQSLELSNSHGVIPANAIIIQEGSPDSIELITYMNVKNVGTKAIDVLCKKSQLSMQETTEVTMCWAGGCYPSSVNISPNAQNMAVGQTITEFVGHYLQSNFQHLQSGESVVRWVFYDQKNVNDSMSVTIKYTSYPLGVEDANTRPAVLSNAYPNPADANATFSYSIPAGTSGVVIVRNLLGATMQSERLPSVSGKYSISTGNLGDGIYFYSLMIDGKISQTKKLVVKH